MKLIRTITFSAGHRYWINNLSEAQNKALFGKWASPYSHGHNFILQVTCEGQVDPVTGMVVNIKDIDDVLKRDIVQVYGQKSLNDEVDSFADKAPSIENILLDIKNRLQHLPEGCKLTHLRLEELPDLWAELNLKNNTMTITRSYEFAASHRLHVPTFSEEENQRLFGKCNNPAGHGHNYVVEVTVAGEPDETTGFICDILEIDRVVNEEVVDRYDHKNLNVDLPEFQNKVTTSEMVVQEIWNRLIDKLPAKLTRVRLCETARSAFEVTAE